MDVRLLGPVEICAGGQELRLGGTRMRALLAVLALRAGTTVSRDELVVALWGERPPASAAKLVQVHISGLRRVLADAGEPARIRTRPEGYELLLEADELDVARAQRLVAAARASLDVGNADGEARAALALWRGVPLGDLADGDLARRERDRLGELWYDAALLSAESDLAAGRPDAALAALDALAADHPLRERVHELRMLALYRSGRQAQALTVYRDVRRTLVDELGLEPGPQLRALQAAILRQDPALAPSIDEPRPAATPAPATASGGRFPRSSVAVLACVVVVALAAAFAAVVHRSRTPARHPAGDVVAELDAATGRLVAQVPVGVGPRDVAAGGGAVWVTNRVDGTVSRIDPRRRRVVRNLPAGAVAGLAATHDHVYVADGAGLVRIDTALMTVRRTRLRPVAGPFSLPRERVPVAVMGDTVWFADDRAGLSRVDAPSGAVRRHVDLGFYPSAIAAAADGLWVADPVGGAVLRIDGTGARTTIPVGARPVALATGGGALWVANALDGTVSHIDPSEGPQGAVRATITVGGNPEGLAADRGGVWVATGPGGALVRIDGRTDRVTRRLRLGQRAGGVAEAGGRLWVALAPAPARPAAAPGRVRIAQEQDDLSNDPALNLAPGAWQLDYAICATLMGYPDRSGRAGTTLIPDAAASAPRVSRDGRTYTFRVRSGLRFSPPSGAPVTAATFRHTFERALDPALGSDAASYLDDLVGERAFVGGRSQHIAGIAAHGDRIAFRLTAPDPAFPAKAAMPYFCAVPDDTPPRRGLDALPTAGPYYIASHAADQQLVLRRNPNYHGPRPRRPDEIDYLFGVPTRRYAQSVDRGAADMAANLPAAGARLAARHGPDSAEGRSGHQRWFANPTLSLRYVRLNAHRPLFASARMRRAVNLAVDRRALATIPHASPLGRPTDQYLPPSMPGFRDATIYPVGGPDVRRARRLAGPGRHRAVLYTGNLPPFTEQAAILRRDLAAIGIDLDVRRFGVDAIRRLAGGGWDLALLGGWIDDYVDPSEFLNMLFEPGRPAALGVTTPARLAAGLRAAASTRGTARVHRYARLDRELAAGVAPFIAIANDLEQDYFSGRVGCQVFQPAYGMDLGTLCAR